MTVTTCGTLGHSKQQTILTTKPRTKNAERRDKFRAIGAAISARNAQTSNDPNWREAINPNPWRPMMSDGFTVMQIDTRPGLCRRERENS